MKKQFDRFTLTEMTAQAGAATVYAGQEQLPGGATRPVLAKVLPALGKSDPSGEKRFFDEVRTMASLAGQPHVVTFYGMGITDGVPWIATEQAPATLAAVLGQPPADPADVARLIEHVARGLASLHALEPQRLHNRLQPGNILVCAGTHYKISEFGLAALASAEPTLDIDSVRYTAPELFNKEFGKPGPPADLYALGHIAYEMALGTRLHRQQFPAVMDSSGRDGGPAKWQAWHHSLPTVVSRANEVVKGFPEPLAEVIAKLMAKPLAARYASAAELLADLKIAIASEAVPGAAGPSAIVAPQTPEQPARFGARPPPMPAATPALGATTASSPAIPFANKAPTATRPAFAASAPATVAPAGGDQRYYVRLRNRTTGPFDLAALQRLARQGQLSRLHQVSTDQQAWKSAGSVEGLF